MRVGGWKFNKLQLKLASMVVQHNKYVRISVLLDSAFSGCLESSLYNVYFHVMGETMEYLNFLAKFLEN